jgi:CheY-like chemotaxis protein
MTMGSFSVLCVDDEPNILRSLGRIFRREGCKMHFATSAEEALKILESETIDLIISDNRMPNITGVEFLAMVKDRWPDTVRIILSGYTEIDSITQAVNEGHVYKFILKPWEDEKLLATVREGLEMATAARQSKQVRKAEGEHRHVLSEALNLAQAILDVLPVPVIGISAEIVVFTNRAAEASRGSISGPLLVSSVRDALSADFDARIRQVQADGAEARFDYVGPDGRVYLAVCTPLPGDGQDGVVVCLLDRQQGAHCPAGAATPERAAAVDAAASRGTDA